MIGDSIEEANARLSELESLKKYIELLIKARKKELKEAKKEAKK